MVKAAIGPLGLPHWLIMVGAILVIAGMIGWLINREQSEPAQADPADQPSQEGRPQMPPLPELLNSQRRRDRRPSTPTERPTDENPT